MSNCYKFSIEDQDELIIHIDYKCDIPDVDHRADLFQKASSVFYPHAPSAPERMCMKHMDLFIDRKINGIWSVLERTKNPYLIYKSFRPCPYFTSCDIECQALGAILKAKIRRY